MTYDGLGRWVERNNNGSYSQAVYGPDGSEVAVMSGSSVISYYLNLPGGAKAVYNTSGLTGYWHPDWLGTPRLYTNTTHSILADTAIGAYGEQYQGILIDTMYTGVGQIVEANDLRTFPARNLSTVEGRWMSPDPAGLGAVDLGNPQSLNRYAYVVGNPFGLVDLTGLDPTQIYTPPITVTGDGPGPISVVSSYFAPGSHCSDRCLDAAEAASYNGAPLIYDLSYRKLVLPAKAGTPAPSKPTTPTPVCYQGGCIIPNGPPLPPPTCSGLQDTGIVVGLAGTTAGAYTGVAALIPGAGLPAAATVGSVGAILRWGGALLAAAGHFKIGCTP